MNIKKISLIILFVLLSTLAFAQTNPANIVVRGGYESNFKRFGVGLVGAYKVTDYIRIAPDATLFFPNKKIWGVDLDVNAQFFIEDVIDNLSVYPYAGLNMSNNRHNKTEEVKGFGFTRFGFNLGGGAEYKLSSSDFISFDMKVVFAKNNFGQVMIGYGYYF